MSATDWVLANKVKTGLGLIAALAAVVVLPIQFQNWTKSIVEEEALKAQGREEVIHGTMRAKHDFDFAIQQITQTEDDLIELEEQVEDGIELTPTQQRKYGKLREDLVRFEDKKDSALGRLSLEDHDEDHTKSDQ